MKILVISDTHHDISKALDVYRRLTKSTNDASGISNLGISSNAGAEIDMVIHCGDYVEDAAEFRNKTGAKVVSVPGNCDGSFDENDMTILETEAGDVLITHGHMLGVSHSQAKIYYRAAEADCIACIYGHTHIPVNTEWEGVHLINPGSLSRPRDNSSGSFAIIETAEDYFSSKIYYYDEFMSSGPDSGSGSGSCSGGPGSGTGKRSKIKGGHLRDLLNYSDRF